MGNGAAAGKTVTVQVVDVTDSGAVNVDYGGALLLDVPCTDAYRNRAAGDWVAMRPGTQPVVMWRLGDDPKDADESRIGEIADGIAHNVQVVRAATWGTDGPRGSGWQTVNGLFMRKTSQGKVELYAQVDNPTDTSPDAPAGRPPPAAKVVPTSSGSWRGGRPDDYATTPTQGDGTGAGNRRGAWFYGTQITDACAGQAVAKMTVAFARKRNTGVTSKRPMHLYLHDHASPPGRQLNLGAGPQELLSLSAGAKGTATLPVSWRDALASGAARGLAIYASGRTDYAAFTGGTITISFSA
nr:hypothetical protein [Streptomyces boncukensis]